jgi:uncharacterized protein
MRIRVKDIPDTGVIRDPSYGEKELLSLLAHEYGREIQLLGRLRVHIELYKHGDHVRIFGSLKGVLRLFCDRCLQPVEWKIDENIDTVLIEQKYAPTEEEIELEKDDLNYEFFEGEAIDVDQLIAEQILLVLPAKVLCSSSCRGLCPVCGANLNYQECGCVRDTKRSSFAALERLKDHLPRGGDS